MRAHVVMAGVSEVLFYLADKSPRHPRLFFYFLGFRLEVIQYLVPQCQSESHFSAAVTSFAAVSAMSAWHRSDGWLQPPTHALSSIRPEKSSTCARTAAAPACRPELVRVLEEEDDEEVAAALTRDATRRITEHGK